MGRKRQKPEEIVAKLRQVEVMTTQGQTVAEANRLALVNYGRHATNSFRFQRPSSKAPSTRSSRDA